MLVVCVFALWAHASTAAAQNRPNIVYILADDMGLGDVRSFTANSPVDTPNLSRIANGGMSFTNAHSPSAVCSPTRYGVLTGQYAWRTRLKSDVVKSHERALIAPDRTTVADMLQQQGYSTAAFGKWHLGMNWQTTNGQAPALDGRNVDYSQPFTGGPTDHGFDSYFGDDIINNAPFTFIKDSQTVGIPSIPFGNGLKTPGYEQVDSLPAYTQRAVQYINDQASAADPFFMFMALTAPHAPIVPPDFIANVGTNYERFIATVDWSVGQVLDALEAQGIGAQTMIVFASDNGMRERLSTSPGISRGYVNGIGLRGQKGDIWEAGHRIPLMVRWDGHVQSGWMSDEYVELNDFYATVADILDVSVPSTAAEDSYSILPVLRGETLIQPLREAGVNHSINGTFAVRHVDDQGTEWKLIFNSGSGGFSGPTGFQVDPTQPIANYAALQLYDMSNDPGEQANLLSGGGTPQAQAKADELQGVLTQYIASGRSTPGPPDESSGGVNSLATLALLGLLACGRRRRRQQAA